MQLNFGVRHHRASLWDETVTLTLTYDQALVLVEFFSRFQDTDGLAFAHPAEYLALSRIAAQIDKAVVDMFDRLGNSSPRPAPASPRGHDGEYRGPKVEAS